MLLIGIGAGFALGLLVLIPAMLITGSQWWHNRHHITQKWPVGCDHCLREWENRRG